MSKIVSVHSFREGTGRSTTTANLAALLASSGLRVGVIDTDIRSPGVRLLLGVGVNRIATSLDSNLSGKRPFAEFAHDVTGSLGEPITGKVFLVPVGLTASDEGYEMGVLSDGVNDLVSDLNLDILLIDSHAGMNDESLFSMSVSDALVVIARPDMQDYQGSAVAVEVARELEVPTVVLVVNEVPAAFNIAEVRERMEDAYKCEVVAVLPHSAELMALAGTQIFALKYPDSPVTAGLRTLVARILQ